LLVYKLFTWYDEREFEEEPKMLSKEQLKGMWISVPTEWTEDYQFDEKTFRDEIALLIDSGVHGLYTTGSTGEFFALDWDEYKAVTDAFLAETVGKVPVQVGANWFNTRDTIKRVRYARDKGADAVQVCFPGWLQMREEDYDQFFTDVYEAVPDIAIIHYNVSHAKKLFKGTDYRRVIPKVPTLIGTKAAVPLIDYLELQVNAPELRHFTGEHVFPLAHLVGSHGMYTSWYMMNPDFFHAYYNLCIDGKQREAAEMTLRLTKWHETAVIPLSDKGYKHAVLDKAFVELGGWLPGNRRTRKPYQPMTDEDFAELKRITAKIMPEFLEYKR
jgi:4-hydroxy-tetrahydrodipicolinate synthase